MTPDFEAARSYAFNLMARQLSSELAYHGLHHTRDQVLPAVQLFCDDLDVPIEEQLYLATAAVFHDIGFVRRYEENETVAVDIVTTLLPDFGYPDKAVQTISDLIMATRMPQQPKTQAEQILCDADLVTLGQDIFFETSMMLRREMANFLDTVSLPAWFSGQYDFLRSHRYFTSAAQKRLQAGKEQNLAELQLLCNGPDRQY